jgi:cation:H+ antiporter
MTDNGFQAGNPLAVLWSGPGIVLSSLMIAWGAEAAQFFIAQGIALAVLALLQTLPEFAIEAVLAAKREVPFLLANLTGALQLLTGLGWPMIYFAAARNYRHEHKAPMRVIRLSADQSIQILSLLAGVIYELFIWSKGALTVYDSVPLLAIYVGYLWVMRRQPPSEQEDVTEIAVIPRAIVRSPRGVRIAAILGLFIVGGTAVFLLADPFLYALGGLAATTGISSFVFIQWVAPMVSEAPEGISAYFWARDHERASIALMNLVSSNISQWTLLAAMLPIVLSFASHGIAPIAFDATQGRELLMTVSQSLLAVLFLINMEVSWLEITGLFLLWVTQFAFSLGSMENIVHVAITWIYLSWSGVELIRLLTGNRRADAWRHFRAILAGSR